MAGVNLHITTISEAEIFKIQENAVPENTKKVTKSVVKITERVYTKTTIRKQLHGSVNILPSFQRTIIIVKFYTFQESYKGQKASETFYDFV